MRLLNVHTRKLEEFFGAYIPYYVILSHRWEIEEVTFQDLQEGRGETMKGWIKIQGCYRQAIEDGFDYAVLDRFVFQYSGDFLAVIPQCLRRPPYSMTNKGLQIELNMLATDPQFSSEHHAHPSTISYVVPLNCVRKGGDESLVAVSLMNQILDKETFERVQCDFLTSYSKPPFLEEKQEYESRPERRVVYVKQPQFMFGSQSHCYFEIRTRGLSGSGLKMVERRLANVEFGHWAKDIDNVLNLRLSNSIGLVRFQKGGDHVILRCSSLDRSANIELLVCKDESARLSTLMNTITDDLLREVTMKEWYGTLFIMRQKVLTGFQYVKGLTSGFKLQIGLEQRDSSGRKLYIVNLSVKE